MAHDDMILTLHEIATLAEQTADDLYTVYRETPYEEWSAKAEAWEQWGHADSFRIATNRLIEQSRQFLVSAN